MGGSSSKGGGSAMYGGATDQALEYSSDELGPVGRAELVVFKKWHHYQTLIERAPSREDSLGDFASLPYELLVRIVAFLPIRDALRTCSTSILMWEVCTDEAIWEWKFRCWEDCEAYPFDDFIPSYGGIRSYLDVPMSERHDEGERRRKGKWRKICLANTVTLLSGEDYVITERLVNQSTTFIHELLGRPDAVTTIQKGSAYFYYDRVGDGLAVCYEDDTVLCVLRHTIHNAYVKLAPRFDPEDTRGGVPGRVGYY